MSRGRFITLEGIEGAGKSTVAQFVRGWLAAARHHRARHARARAARRWPSGSARSCWTGAAKPFAAEPKHC